MIKAYFDGACQPINPGGTMSYGCIIIQDEKEIKRWGRIYVPKKEIKSTNNLAEYAGLIAVLLHLENNKLEKEEIQIYGDSKLVIKQMQGEWRIDGDKPYGYLGIKAAEIIQKFPKIKFKWIPREENYSADAMAESALIQAGIKLRQF